MLEIGFFYSLVGYISGSQTLPFDYEDNYHRELARRNELRAAVSTPLGILTLLGSLLGFMLQRYAFSLDLGGVLFGLLALATAVGIGTAAFFLARAIHGHTYKHIECAMRLREHHLALREWHEEYGQGKEGANSDFDEYLEKSYAIAGDHNARLNEARSADIFRAHRAMIFSGVFVGAAFLPFSYGVHDQNQEPIQVRIVDEQQSLHIQEE